VTWEAQPGVMVEADPRLTRIALENLIGNAWKFTGRTPKATISFGSSLRDGQTVYFIRDNGAGFDMQYVDRLFTAFQRLHGDRDFKGSGIGLATVARIIHRHHGSIWAEGSPEHGATFFFTLMA
jgi:light-regulated signal transduction histidine kinase (bacteriophytochrome)